MYAVTVYRRETERIRVRNPTLRRVYRTTTRKSVAQAQAAAAGGVQQSPLVLSIS
jgi:hypothetical protein